MSTTIEAPPRDRVATPPDHKVVLREVPWATYLALREPRDNSHLRMTYHDGVLELMSPGPLHEWGSRRLDQVVMAVAMAFRIPCTGAGSMTLRRPGEGPKKGSGKEADQSFYVGHEPPDLRKVEFDPTVDPPPDLAIEVDVTTDSQLKRRAYAALGVGELWLHDANEVTLRFLKLEPDGSYAEIENSLNFPMLTPALVLEGVQVGQGMHDSFRLPILLEWARNGFRPPPAGA